MLDFSPVAPLCENMTSSTKPEVRNLFHFRQGRTTLWPQVTCNENLVKFGRVAFEICEQTDKAAYKHTDTLTMITILRFAHFPVANKYLNQKSFRSEVVVCRHTPDQVLFLDH